MNKKPCEIPECPALAGVGRATCSVHDDARLAKDLHIAKDRAGRGAKRCIECNRAFAETDWCWKTLRKRTNVKQPGDHYGHAHVQCRTADAAAIAEGDS